MPAFNTYTAGGRRRWTKVLNLGRNNEPNWKASTTYRVDDCKYVTDDSKRVVKVFATLLLLTRDRHVSQQRRVGKLVNAYGDDGGHLVACTLGGTGEAINMVPMSRVLNQGRWKRMENWWKRLLKVGRLVDISIDITYPGISRRPCKFKVLTRCNDGNWVEKFKNLTQ